MESKTKQKSFYFSDFRDFRVKLNFTKIAKTEKLKLTLTVWPYYLEEKYLRNSRVIKTLLDHKWVYI
jgi:hypothetical protein